jgi:hypothetical protein
MTPRAGTVPAGEKDKIGAPRSLTDDLVSYCAICTRSASNR